MAAHAAPAPAHAASAWARGRAHLTGWGFSLPFLLLFAVFWALPILAALWLSFTDFGLRDLRDPTGAQWVGLDNYRALLDDDRFRSAALNTAYFVLIGVPLTLGAGLLAAVALNQSVVRARALFRVGFYLPVVTTIVAIAVIWRYLLQPDYGLLNTVLEKLGIVGPDWLGEKSTAMPSIIALGVWRNMGFAMVVFLAGLQTIPAQLYEAVRIDGAGRWAAFRHVTLPGLRPTLLFLLVLTTIGYLQLFEEPFVMTKGGPLDSTLSVSMYTYEEGFRFFHLGVASAASYLLFMVVAVIAVLQFRLLRPQDGRAS